MLGTYFLELPETQSQAEFLKLRRDYAVSSGSDPTPLPAQSHCAPKKNPLEEPQNVQNKHWKLLLVHLISDGCFLRAITKFLAPFNRTLQVLFN